MASSSSQDNGNFIEDVMEYLGSTMSREDLQRLLTEHEDWEAFVAEAELNRDEEAELREALKELTARMAEEDQEKPQNEMQEWEESLEAFPGLKAKVEEHIRKLRALAHHIDALHWHCTVSNVVADSTSAASSLLTLLGLVLAPVTAGGSLLISASGLGLGVAAAATSATSAIVEESSKLSAIVEANHLVSTGISFLEELAKSIAKTAPKCYKLYKNLKYLGKHIRAIRLTRANPHLLVNARIFTSTGGLPAQSARQVQSASEGTALATPRRVRIRNTLTAGAFLAMDVYNLVTESIHLHEGARSELAEILRKLAQDMEEKLGEVIQIYGTLRQ